MPFRSLLILILLVCGTAHAKRFRNAYLSFELPPNWNCKLEGSEWVCENEFSGKTKEAIIILTAKEVGPTDTLAAYLQNLQTPRNLPGRAGQTVKSQVIHVKERMIANQMWVDGMHLGSEVGPYFTRYLATIKERIAILVTFSAHKEHFTKYSGDFMKAVDSMRVVATKDSFGNRDGGPGGAGGPNGTGGETTGPPSASGPDIEMPHEGGNRRGIASGLFTWLILAVLLGAIGFYFYVTGGGKGSGRKKKPSASGGSKGPPGKGPSGPPPGPPPQKKVKK